MMSIRDAARISNELCSGWATAFYRLFRYKGKGEKKMESQVPRVSLDLGLRVNSNNTNIQR